MANPQIEDFIRDILHLGPEESESISRITMRNIVREAIEKWEMYRCNIRIDKNNVSNRLSELGEIAWG